jgi:thiamine-monophosphate kinase
MLGLAEIKHLALRSGCRPGDILFVTGELGGSIKGRHFRFFPRVEEAQFLKRFKVRAMIDISDGLAQDLAAMARRSRVGAVLYEELIPVSREASGLEDALYSGEDFELLFSLPRAEAKRLLRRKIINFKPIGEIVNARYGLQLIDAEGRPKRLAAKGYRHF